MKKEKLLVKEINVLSEVICRKVNDERKRLLDERVKKDKEYLGLLKKMDEYNKKLKEMEKLEKGFDEVVKKIEKRLSLGNGYDDKSKIGSLSFNSVLSSNYGRKEVFIMYSVNSVYNSEVYNKLMIENIDGDLKVDDLVNRLVKEFVGK